MSKPPLTTSALSELTVGLNKLARNLWWTWNQEAQEIFQELSPRGWQNLYHNAVAILHEVSEYELRVRLQDPQFAQRVRPLFLELRQAWGGIPFDVVNDGEVTALAGAMSLEDNAVLGIALGSSQAAGYVDHSGNITGWLNELAFVPVDYRGGLFTFERTVH